MIIVRFSGGLGNQIYQYALLRKIQLRYPDVRIKMDLSFYKRMHIHNGYELEKLFGISKKGVQRAENKELLKVRCEIPFEAMEKFPERLIKPAAWLNARSRRIFTECSIRNEIKEEIQKETGEFESLSVDKLAGQIENMDIRKNWYIDGYWQNELFFREAVPVLLEELQFPEFKDQRNIELEKMIKNTQAVSIHIRRGDYVNSCYDVLTLKYYESAIRYLEERKSSLMYYIFTDDVQYAEREFSFLRNKYIVRHNMGEKSWCDMKLMSLCKYNILANSSFSNWAGYVNKNSDRIIIYPSKYTKQKENTDKFGEGWIKLNI